MFIKKIYALLLIIGFTCACNFQNKDKITQLNWLEGVWLLQSDEQTNTYEVWKKNNNILEGAGYSDLNGELTKSENIWIKTVNDTLYYFAQVLNQNDQEIIPFRLTHQNINSWTFSNENHDFPNRISYTKKPNNMLFVQVSGMLHAKEKTITFTFQKINNQPSSL